MREKPTAAETYAETNDRAVFLSEEVDFLEGLAELITDPDAKRVIEDRLDLVREALITVPPEERAHIGDGAEDGVEAGADSDDGISLEGWPEWSEPYDPEDDLGPLEPEDEDENDT